MNNSKIVDRFSKYLTAIEYQKEKLNYLEIINNYYFYKKNLNINRKYVVLTKK